jgi:hypothetical protein
MWDRPSLAPAPAGLAMMRSDASLRTGGMLMSRCKPSADQGEA